MEGGGLSCKYAVGTWENDQKFAKHAGGGGCLGAGGAI